MNLQKSLQKSLADKGYKSQKALCDATGIPQSMLSRMNKNSANIKIGSVASVARSLGMTVSEFIAMGE